MKIRSLFLSLISGISLLYACPANAYEDILNRIEKGTINEIRFRIRTSTYPMNYSENNTLYDHQTVMGFCVDLANKLQEKLNTEYREDSEKKVTVDYQNHIYYKVDKDKRFESIRKKETDIQCGADSIVDADEIIFSKPFFGTGMNILMTKEASEKAASEKAASTTQPGELENKLIIGAIENTTTATTLNSRKDTLDLDLEFTIQEYPSRFDGLEALKRREIDAFASDDILLQGFIKNPKEKETNNYFFYIKERKKLFTEEYYGVVFHEANYQLRNYVNELVDEFREEYTQKLSNQGFDISVSEKQLLTKERDDLVSEKQLLTEKRNDLVNEKQLLTKERDDLVKERDNLVVQRFSLFICLIIFSTILFLYLFEKWISMQKIDKRFASLKYKKNKFNIEAFLYALNKFEGRKNIIIDNKSDVNSEEILFKISMDKEKDIQNLQKQFDIYYKYKENQTVDNNQSQERSQETYAYQDFKAIIEDVRKIDKCEGISIIINVTIDNDKLNTDINQKGNYGIGTISEAEIKGDPKVSGINNENKSENPTQLPADNDHCNEDNQ